MEGNRFHDAGTPPPLDLNLIPTRSHSRRRPALDRRASTRSEGGDTVGGQNAGQSMGVTSANLDKSAGDEEKAVGESVNYTDHALDLVETLTHQDKRRKPSKRSVLSNLLKLDLFDQRRNEQGHSHRPYPYHGRRTPPSHTSTSKRPTHQLRSIASSRSLLAYLGKNPQSARSSLYFDEMYKAEDGMDEAALAAQRLRITTEIADIIQRQDFVIKLGKSLVRSGAPSHRIEAAMEKTSDRLEIDGSYIVLPGLIMVSFGDPETHTSETHLIKCSRSLDIGKLERVNNIAHRVSKGKMDLGEASILLDEIKGSPPTWNLWFTLLGYTLSSAFVAPLFFNGSWTDCWVSGIFGLVVGLITYVAEKAPMFGNVYEMVISIAVAVITIALRDYVCFTAVALSAIVIALPGYSLTSAVMELSTKNIGSGAIHLVHAIMYVLFLGFGLGYGSSIWSLSHSGADVPLTSACLYPISPWWFFLLLPLATMSIAVVFGASLKQWPPMVADAAVGFTVYYFLTRAIGAGNGAMIVPSVGAFALGLAGNIYQRVTKRLAFVPLIGGIIILVPGSIGVRGAIQLFDGSDNANGGMFAVQIIGIALSITLGLFLSNLCIYPTGRKRSVFLGF